MSELPIGNKFLWCHAGMLFEDLGEIERIAVAAGSGNFCDVGHRSTDAANRMADAQLVQIFAEILVHIPLEQMRQIFFGIGVDARDFL